MAAKLGTGIINNVYNALKTGLLTIIRSVFLLMISADNQPKLDNAHLATRDMI